MSGERSTRGHALLYMAPTLVQSLLPILTLPIFTRVLTREEYGLWGIATAFGALVAGTFGAGLQAGFERNYFAVSDSTLRARLLYSVAVLAASLQALALAGILAASDPLAARMLDTPRRGNLLALGFGIAAVGSIKMFFLSALRNEGRAGEYVRYSVDELFLGTTLALVAVLWLDWGAAGLMAGPLIAGSLVLMALIASYLRRARFGLDTTQLRDVLRVSLPLTPRALIGSIGNQLDRLVIGAVGSLSAVGVYAIGQRMAQLVFAALTALQNVYQPRVYQMLFAKDDARRLGGYLMPFAYVSAAVALGVVLFADEIVKVVTESEFWAAAPVTSVLAVHYGLMFFGKQPQLIYARRGDVIVLLSALAVLLNAAGTFIGARSGGSLGAALGVLIAGMVSGTLFLLVGNRFAPIGYPVRSMAITFGALPAALLTVFALPAWGIPALIAFVIKLAIFATFLAVGWRTGIIAAVWRGSIPTADTVSDGLSAQR